MTPELRQRVLAACNDYFDTPADQRPVFLEQLRSSNPDVARELESMLEPPTIPSLADESSLATETLEEPSKIPLSEDLPRQAGRYEIQAEIARGGMGAVLRVRDPDFERTLAVKIMLPKASRHPDAQKRFLEEAKITGRLQHPGIPPAHELGRLDNGMPFFAMKLIKGRTLAALLKDRVSRKDDENAEKSSSADSAPLRDTLPRFLTIFGQVCQTIAYAHSRGIIHRDLKPANIMVGAFGEVQVMDWGLAKVLSQLSEEADLPSAESSTVFSLRADDNADLSRTGDVMGTPSYMAPEQARGQIRTLDPRCDVFGLGAILCQILTGEPPFRGKTSREVLTQAADGDLRDAFGRLDACAVDAELIDLAKRCLAADRKDRPRDAGEVAAAIEAYENQVQEKLRRAELEKAAAEAKAAEERRRRRMQLLLAAVIMLAVVAGVGVGTAFYVQRRVQAKTYGRNINSALESATGKRQELHALLRDPSKSKGPNLIDRPEEWKAKIDSAWADVRQAEGLCQNAGSLVDASLLDRVRKLKEQIQADRADRVLVLQLDKIREDRSAFAGDKNKFNLALREYSKAFSDAGIKIEQGDPVKVAGLISRSPIKWQLVAALDDWAFVAWLQKKRDLWGRILQVGRTIDPEPMRARLRDPKLWENKEAILKLARELQQDPNRMAALPPQTLVLFAHLLPNKKDAQDWLWRAQSLHPDDFWLAVYGFIVLYDQSKKPGAAEGMCRTALAIRPDSVFAWCALGIVLHDQKKLDEAIAANKKALQFNRSFAPAWYGLGCALRDQKKLDEAFKAYKKTLHIDPQFATAWYSLGLVLYDQKKPDEAIKTYRKALQFDPKFTDAWNGLGVALRDQKKLGEAIKAYKTALKFDPESFAAWNNLGLALRDQKKLNEAVKAYRKAVQFNAQSAQAWNGLGAALHDQKKLDEAIEACKKALELDPQYTDAWNNLGNVLRDQKKLDEAIKVYKKTLELNPQYLPAWNNLGNALRDQKKLDEAIAAYKKALEIDPQFAFAWNGLGNVLSDQKKLGEAINAYKKALQFDPQYSLAWNNLGNALRDQRKLAEAIAAYEKALQIDPQNAIAWYNLGIVLRQQKKLDEAINAFQETLRINPQFAKGWANLGAALTQRMKINEAIVAFRKALEIDPRHAHAWTGLGIGLHQQKKLGDAIDAFQTALRIDRGDAIAWICLGTVLRDAGRFDEAMTACDNVVRLLPSGHRVRLDALSLQKQCRRLLALEKRLPEILKGGKTTSIELLTLADLCQRYLKRNRDAVQLYKAMLKETKALSPMNLALVRYNGACCAALAASAKGQDASKIDGKEKTKLRQQAQQWLRSALQTFEVLRKDAPLVAVGVQQQMEHWQKDADLAGVREPETLAKLPEAERKQWQKLWSDVKALRKNARASYHETVLKGSLTDAKGEQVHDLKLTTGKTYVIEMQSKHFDTYLRLEDAKHKKLAENDDLVPGKNLNSRLIFTPKQTGTYRLIATSFQQRGRGAYEIIVREFASKK